MRASTGFVSSAGLCKVREYKKALKSPNCYEMCY